MPKTRVTVKDRSTFGAALTFSFPGCEARTTTEPAPLSVMVLSTTVAGPDTMVNAVGNPEEAFAEMIKGGSSDFLSGMIGKAIVCESLVTLNDRSTCIAGS